MTTEIIEKTNKPKSQRNYTKHKKELIENLEVKRDLMLQFKGEKKDNIEEIEQSQKLAKNRENILIEDMTKRIEKGEIEKKIGKKTTTIGFEILRNIACYSHTNKPIIFQLIKEENKLENNYIIRSRNYYLDPTGKKTQILEKRIKEGNELTKEELKEKRSEAMKKEGLNKYGNAGLGYIEIARKLKEMKEQPFTYEFTKQKDGTVKFDLTITIPELKKEGKQIKKTK